MKNSAVAILLLGATLPAWADYEVDVDLGVLPLGETPVVGTTAERTIEPGPPPVTIGGNNNSLFVKDEFGDPLVVDGDLQTWGNEIVFQFELATPAFVSITSNSIDGDADFFLLDGLSTSPDPSTGKLSATQGIDVALLDQSPPQTTTFFPLRPGVYYLAVENYDGVDPNLNSGDTVFDVTLNVQEAEAIDLALDIGLVAAADSPIYLNTFGSLYNTELAVYDLFGNLLAENDDAGDSEQSEIVLPDGLPAGIYYAVIAGNDTVFEDSFGISTGGAVGDWILNFPLGPLLDPGELSGTTEAGSPGVEAQYILFNIAERPSEEEIISLGVIASANEPFAVDTRGSEFDTQLSMFDSEGFWQSINDDILFIDPGNPANELQSELVYDDGLPAGTYYFAVAGYPHQYGDGFFLSVDFDVSPISEGGPYVFNFPGGSETGSIASGEFQWFSAEVVAGPNTDIDITDISYDSATNQFTVSWESGLEGPFKIRVGNVSDVAALQAAPENILPIEAAGEATSPATFTVPAELQDALQVFLQVTN